MEKRVALIGIIVSNDLADNESVDKLNQILHEYRNYVIGRMGVPYNEKNIGIISVAVDAPSDIINAISGKLGALQGIHTKTLYART